MHGPRFTLVQGCRRLRSPGLPACGCWLSEPQLCPFVALPFVRRVGPSRVHGGWPVVSDRVSLLRCRAAQEAQPDCPGFQNFLEDRPYAE